MCNPANLICKGYRFSVPLHSSFCRSYNSTQNSIMNLIHLNFPIPNHFVSYLHLAMTPPLAWQTQTPSVRYPRLRTPSQKARVWVPHVLKAIFVLSLALIWVVKVWPMVREAQVLREWNGHGFMDAEGNIGHDTEAMGWKLHRNR
jgi:hypothetical protein